MAGQDFVKKVHYYCNVYPTYVLSADSFAPNMKLKWANQQLPRRIPFANILQTLFWPAVLSGCSEETKKMYLAP